MFNQPFRHLFEIKYHSRFSPFVLVFPEYCCSFKRSASVFLKDLSFCHSILIEHGSIQRRGETSVKFPEIAGRRSIGRLQCVWKKNQKTSLGGQPNLWKRSKLFSSYWSRLQSFTKIFVSWMLLWLDWRSAWESRPQNLPRFAETLQFEQICNTKTITENLSQCNRTEQKETSLKGHVWENYDWKFVWQVKTMEVSINTMQKLGECLSKSANLAGISRR